MRVLSGDHERLLGWFSPSSRTLSVTPSARTSRSWPSGSTTTRLHGPLSPGRCQKARCSPSLDQVGLTDCPPVDEHIPLRPVGETDDDALRGIDGDQPRAGQPERRRRARGADDAEDQRQDHDERREHQDENEAARGDPQTRRNAATASDRGSARPAAAA